MNDVKKFFELEETVRDTYGGDNVMDDLLHVYWTIQDDIIAWWHEMPSEDQIEVGDFQYAEDLCGPDPISYDGVTRVSMYCSFGGKMDGYFNDTLRV